MNNMKCFCGNDLIWGGDHMFDECGMEGEGIVSNLSCSNCDAFVLVHIPIKNDTTD
tara:strand:- start:164 stop:331 length:168 start_codon:yes stop_codon:yes gene_type:complete